MLTSIEYLQPEPDNFFFMDNDNVREQHSPDNNSNRSLPPIELVSIDSGQIQANEELPFSSTPKHLLGKQQRQFNLSVIADKNDSTDNVLVSASREWMSLDPSNNLTDITPNRAESVHKPQCTECKNEFSSKHSLKLHMLLHSDNARFECETCNKKFISKFKLESHQAVHLEIKPFTCNSCEKAYYTKHALNRHILVHNNCTPWACETCNKKFNMADKLKAHQTVHLIARRFPCNSCHKTYARKQALKSHMKKHTAAQQLEDLPSLETHSIDSPPTPLRSTHLQYTEAQPQSNLSLEPTDTPIPKRLTHLQFPAHLQDNRNITDQTFTCTSSFQRQSAMHCTDIPLQTEPVDTPTSVQISRLQYSVFKRSSNPTDRRKLSNAFEEQHNDLVSSLETQTITYAQSPMQPPQSNKRNAGEKLSYNAQLQGQEDLVQSAQLQYPVYPRLRVHTADGKLSAVINAVSSLYKWSQSLNSLNLGEKSPAVSN